VWWYRHPGNQAARFSPGDEIPARRKNGQPKTLAEALVLLEAERARAAELEDAAKRAQTQEGVLRNELTALRDELTEERTKLATLRDELSDERKKQAETDLLWRKAEERADEMEASYNSLADDLEKAEEYTSELEEEVESVRRKAEDVRYDLEQEIKQLRRELDEQMPSKERASAEQEELKRRFEELRIRFDESERAVIDPARR
jgi:chromosome segregation ATPase